MALGAQAEQVKVLVLREVSWLAVTGVAIGICCVLGLTRLVDSMLFGLKPYDPATRCGVAALLMVISLLAGYVAGEAVFLYRRIDSSVESFISIGSDKYGDGVISNWGSLFFNRIDELIPRREIPWQQRKQQEM
jgi:hypothetical protein